MVIFARCWWRRRLDGTCLLVRLKPGRTTPPASIDDCALWALGVCTAAKLPAAGSSSFLCLSRSHAVFVIFARCWRRRCLDGACMPVRLNHGRTTPPASIDDCHFSLRRAQALTTGVVRKPKFDRFGGYGTDIDPDALAFQGHFRPMHRARRLCHKSARWSGRAERPMPITVKGQGIELAPIR